GVAAPALDAVLNTRIALSNGCTAAPAERRRHHRARREVIWQGAIAPIFIAPLVKTAASVRARPADGHVASMTLCFGDVPFRITSCVRRSKGGLIARRLHLERGTPERVEPLTDARGQGRSVEPIQVFPAAADDILADALIVLRRRLDLVEPREPLIPVVV